MKASGRGPEADRGSGADRGSTADRGSGADCVEVDDVGRPFQRRPRPVCRGAAPALAASLAAAALVAAFVLIAVQSATDGFLVSWDARIAEAVVESRTIVGSRVFWAFTLLGTTPVVIALTVAVSSLLALWGRRLYALAFAVGLGVAGGVSALLKAVLQRTRPPETLALIDMPSSHALPSGHALVMGVFVGLLLMIVLRTWTGAPDGPQVAEPRSGGARKRALAMAAAGIVVAGIVVAAAIGLSRVYLGVHWLSDVVAGWCMAGVLLLVFRAVLRKWEQGSWRPGDVRPWRSSRARAVVLTFATLAVVLALVLTAWSHPLLM